MYSATSFVISSGTPTMTATATKDWTLHFRKGRGGYQVHSATLTTASITDKTMLACLAMPLQGQATQGTLTAQGRSGGAGIRLPSVRKD